MTDEIEFVNELPPAYDPATRPSKYEPFIQALKGHPGQWAVLPYTGNNHVQVASAIRNGGGKGRVSAYKAFMPRDQFEVAVRKKEIYVRFMSPSGYEAISDADVLRRVIELDMERSYSERPTEEVEQDAKPYEAEATRRFGVEALENLGQYCVEHHATGEDLLASLEKDGAEPLVGIVKGER